MPDSTPPVFLVDAQADPVVIRIEGRASFMNSAGVKDFIAEMRRQGRVKFVVDFHRCASMDSTFLGVLAGTALELRKLTPPGTLILARAGERNLELIRNLGLHRLAVVADAAPVAGGSIGQVLDAGKKDELENARLVLEAHENLVAADGANAAKFQDVLAFLRNRVAGGR
jgi:anti-anti-sigma regulatory factor